MNLAHHLSDAACVRRRAASIGVLVALLSGGLLLPLSSAQAATTVPLGTAESFAVLAGQSVTNTGPTTITGDIGIHPGATDPPNNVTGSGSISLTGTLHDADAVAEQAKVDLVTAYDDAAGQTPVTEIPTELGTTTLKAGVYDSAAGTFGITGPLTLDGEDDPDAVFIFQMGSTLTTASASSVNLINGADICNVFWQVGSSATLGTGSSMVGTIMALESITLTTGATVEGRVLARNGSVTMDTNTITNEACTTATDDTPTVIEPDDGTTDGDDDTTGDEDTSGDGDTADDDGDTTGQVTRVPTGGVPAGGGDDPVPSGMLQVFTWMLTFVAVVGTVGVAVRRRVRA